MAAPAATAAPTVGWAVTKTGAKMLAPKGWSCNAQYGADGTGGITVHPATGSFGPHSEQIDAQTTGGCSVCAVGVACDMFKSAATAYTAVIPGSKCHSRPAGETVVHLTPNIVAFEIPPHVGGEGVYPDNGVLTYYAAPSSLPLTWQGDCLLPQGEHHCARPSSTSSSPGTELRRGRKASPGTPERQLLSARN